MPAAFAVSSAAVAAAPAIHRDDEFDPLTRQRLHGGG